MIHPLLLFPFSHSHPRHPGISIHSDMLRREYGNGITITRARYGTCMVSPEHGNAIQLVLFLDKLVHYYG
nr:hypothetical protein Q903MT_gene1351 [Picea sitchensis]